MLEQRAVHSAVFFQLDAGALLLFVGLLQKQVRLLEFMVSLENLLVTHLQRMGHILESRAEILELLDAQRRHLDLEITVRHLL